MAHLIMENDSMFSVREKPWHYAETADRCKIIQEAPNSKEALIAAGLDWEVKQCDVYMDGNIIIPNTKANYRVDNNGNRIALGVVSDRYKIVQNVDAFSFTDNIIGEFNGGEVRYETAGSMQNGKRVWMLAKMPTVDIAGDEVEPYMCFTNAHDGKGAIQVCMTPIRVVCNNTLSLALSSAKRSWATKHMGDLDSKMEEAKLCLGLAKTYMDNLAIDADKLANKRLYKEQLDEILDELFPVKDNDSERKKRNIKQMKDDFYVCYFMPDIAQFRDTAWGAVNAMSDLVTHGKPQRNTKNFEENRWSKIADGHPIMDKFYELVNAKVNV